MSLGIQAIAAAQNTNASMQSILRQLSYSILPFGTIETK